MGRLKYFQIKLENNPSGVYFGGDIVRGKIFIGLEGNGKKARGKEEKKDAKNMQTPLSFIVFLFCISNFIMMGYQQIRTESML